MFVRYNEFYVLVSPNSSGMITNWCFLKQACGNKVLRGRHEWEHHSQGRAHRKRTTQLKKAQTSKSREKQEEEKEEVEIAGDIMKTDKI